MALSGSNDGTARPYTAQSMLEEACSRAGITPELITSEMVEKALDQMNLIFTHLLNRGFQLWKRQQLILACYQTINQMPLPAGYNIVDTLNRRTLQRQTGTAFTNAGGTASLAFDDDFDTYCTQTSLNGSIGALFSSATSVTTVGVLSGAAGTWTLYFEWSQDGVTYTTSTSDSVTFAAAKEWYWIDLPSGPPSGALYWRVRSAGSTNFSAAEIFFGNLPSEINLGQWSLDDYSNMPNKSAGGQVTNWYQQRNRTQPVLYVWPTPDQTAKYDTLVMWATSYLDTVSQITQDLDLPLRWYDAVTAMLARRLCRSLREADLKRYDMLMAEEKEATWLAEAEERDPAPITYDLGLSNYTV